MFLARTGREDPVDGKEKLPSYYELHKDERKAYQREYYARHRERRAEYQRKRRALQKRLLAEREAREARMRPTEQRWLDLSRAS
jgi:hypothetical protein